MKPGLGSVVSARGPVVVLTGVTVPKTDVERGGETRDNDGEIGNQIEGTLAGKRDRYMKSSTFN